MRDWAFVTSSADKFLEVERILRAPVAHKAIDLPEIQALEIEDVVEQKALSAYEALGHVPVIVEDSGLFVDAWHGLPGALIRWFEASVGCGGLCKMLDGFPSRAAHAKTVIATYDGSLKLYSGRLEGSIAEDPRGSNGFGWDTIFVPLGDSRTFAEMSPAEKDRRSMRAIALNELARRVSEL